MTTDTIEDAGYMTGEQYKTALRLLGMTHGGKSTLAFLGIQMSTTYRYASDQTSVPKPVAMLLRLMIRKGLTPAAVERISREVAL